MSAAVHDLVLALCLAGLAVVVLASLAALAVRTVLARLHLITPITSVGGPLIGLALAIQNGWGLTSGQILLIVVLLGVTGPVLEAATGRLHAQQQEIIRQESPQ